MISLPIFQSVELNMYRKLVNLFDRIRSPINKLLYNSISQIIISNPYPHYICTLNPDKDQPYLRATAGTTGTLKAARGRGKYSPSSFTSRRLVSIIDGIFAYGLGLEGKNSII